MPTPNDIRALAFDAAQLDAALTVDLIARALDLPLDTAREAAARGAFAGLLRPRKLPGHGNKMILQPTARAAGLPPATAPFSLRCVAPAATIERSLLRAAVRYLHHPELSYLPRPEVTALYRRYGLHQQGHPAALVGLDGARFNLFFPLLIEAGTSPAVAIETVIARHYNVLESGCASLHFVAFAGAAADAVQAELDQLSPTTAADTARAELTAIDAAVAADKSGLTTLRSASRRAELAAALADAQEQTDDLFQWLDRSVLEVSV